MHNRFLSGWRTFVQTQVIVQLPGFVQVHDEHQLPAIRRGLLAVGLRRAREVALPGVVVERFRHGGSLRCQPTR